MVSIQVFLLVDYMFGMWIFDCIYIDGYVGVFVFFVNGMYLYFENGFDEGYGYLGFEVGIYDWLVFDSCIVCFVFFMQLDINGDWGVYIFGLGNEFSVDVFIYQGVGLKCFFFLDVFGVVCSFFIGNGGLLGGWYVGVGYGNVLMLVFLFDGIYLQVIDFIDYIFEIGFYSFDVIIGVLSVSNVYWYGGVDLMFLQMGSIIVIVVGG